VFPVVLTIAGGIDVSKKIVIACLLKTGASVEERNDLSF